jgi:hypothetical protein
MRQMAVVAGLALLGGCQEAPAPPPQSDIGKYQIVVTAQGTMRINTETGRTHMAVPSETVPNGAYAMIGGKPLVWYEVHTEGPI